MQHKDAELGLVASKLLPRRLDILFQLLDRVLKGRSRVVHLVNDQHPLADQVAHLAQAAEVQPLRARDLGAGHLLDHTSRRQRLVQRQADGLDGDVGAAGLLEETAQDARGNVSAAANGNHELRLEGGEDGRGGFLAELVDLLDRTVRGTVRRDTFKPLGRLKERPVLLHHRSGRCALLGQKWQKHCGATHTPES